MLFNLCSSAGVQGVFVRLFFVGGGPEGGPVMLGSVAPVAGAAAVDGPDIGTVGAIVVPEARLLLLRALVGERVSGCTTTSGTIGRG